MLSFSVGEKTRVRVSAYTHGGRGVRMFEGVVSPGNRRIPLIFPRQAAGCFIVELTLGDDVYRFTHLHFGKSARHVGTNGVVFTPAGLGKKQSIVDTLVFSREGSVTLRFPIPEYAGTYDAVLQCDVLTYSNLPGGLTARTDARWGESSTAYPSGWAANAPNHGGTVGITDANAASPTGGSLNVMFPAGLAPGLQTTTVYYLGIPSGATELFLGTTDRYRAPWQMMGQHVKLDLFQCPDNFIGIFDGNSTRASGPFTFWGGGTGQATISASGLTLESSTWNNNIEVVPALDPDAGKWYKRELYLRRSTTSTSADGIVRMWVDGTLVLDVTNANYYAGFLFGEFQHAGTWGGGGIAVIANQTWEIARTFIATR